MSRFENTDQLLSGILEGQVPRQVRLFAAQGLLPVSREELLRLQTMLSTDPDEELAKIATESVLEIDKEAVVEWVDHGGELESMVLDLLIRLREEESVWVAVARHENVSDETLRVLAKNGSSVVQDIVITNQVRVFACLEILDDLRANSQATDTVLRRVREFEEEFLQKAIAAEEALAALEAPTIEEALDALRGIGAHIPALEELPYQKSDDPGVNEAVGAAGGTESAFGRLTKMNIKEKVLCALKGTREERSILINSRNRLVIRGVLSSPKLSDGEVEVFAGSRTVDTEALRIINRNPRWMRRYQVVWQMSSNPKTPVDISLRLIQRLNIRDLKRLMNNRNVPPVVRRNAETIASRRR